jgi:ADP-heptose:LPS heptosyltransferase
MYKIKRFISVFIRSLQSQKKLKIQLNLIDKWLLEQKQLPSYIRKGNKLLIIRVDDIGDYLLFRNLLSLYKQSKEWNKYDITLLGNVAWKEIFDRFDSKTVDKVIWMNKASYLEDKTYRITLWEQLRDEGFEIVICPSRTRPLLIDDMCALATGAAIRLGAENNFKEKRLNDISNRFYTDLFQSNELIHEFTFNKYFAYWCTKIEFLSDRPELTINKRSQNSEPYLICFIGASSKSKKWPAKNWIKLIELIQKNYHYILKIAGGKKDLPVGNYIAEKVKIKNITGATSLSEMTDEIANASIVITQDTMAAHLAISCNTATIIIANGNNFYRFTDYSNIKTPNVKTIYPPYFKSILSSNKKHVILDFVAVSADIATIKADVVFDAFKKLLEQEKSSNNTLINNHWQAYNE